MSLTLSLQFPAGRYVAAAWSDKDALRRQGSPALGVDVANSEHGDDAV